MSRHDDYVRCYLYSMEDHAAREGVCGLETPHERVRFCFISNEGLPRLKGTKNIVSGAYSMGVHERS
jgi:hypothetical protein